MKTSILSKAILSWAGVILLLAFSAVSFAQDKERVDKVSNKNFAATVKAVETALQRNGFMVVATIDHQNMLTMVGAKIKGATTIELGKADMGKMLLSSMAPEAGLEMPGRFCELPQAVQRVQHVRQWAGHEDGARHGRDVERVFRRP